MKEMASAQASASRLKKVEPYIILSSLSVLVSIISLILAYYRLQMTPTKLENSDASCLDERNAVSLYQMISSLTKKPDGHRDHLMHAATPASAHLQLRGPLVDAKSNAYGAPFDSSPKEPFFASTCRIQDKPEDWTNVEHARGVEVSKDGITIKYPGLYYVYCSLGFTNTSDVSVTNYVERLRPESPGDDGVLLKAVHGRQHDGLQQGGVFRLDKGDKLRVFVMPHGEMNVDSASSYIGLFMLSPGDAPD